MYSACIFKRILKFVEWVQIIVFSTVCNQWHTKGFLGRSISTGGLGWMWYALIDPEQSPGEDRKLQGGFKDLVLWNNLLLIKIYPPRPVMKLIQRIFFQKPCPNSSLK